MGQKTHPVQLRASKPLHSSWYSRSQYADILHYEIGLRKTLGFPFRERTSIGPIFTVWNPRGLSLTLTYLSKKENLAFGKESLSLPSSHRTHMASHKSGGFDQVRPYFGKHKASVQRLCSFLQQKNCGNSSQASVLGRKTHTKKTHNLWSPLILSSRAYGWWIRRIQAFSLESSCQTAQTVAQSLVQRIEEGGKIRNILDTTIREAQNSTSVQGMKIRIAGRLQGAEIASAQSKQWGLLGLNTLSQRVDYAHERAHISAGIIGVQVWLSFRRKDMKSSSR